MNDVFTAGKSGVLYCSTFKFDFADNISVGNEKRLILYNRTDKEMFDPEFQNVDCPQCFLGKIYFDREIGYYCMYCGDQFSAEDMEILIEKNAITSNFGQKSNSSLKKPAVEIKEIHPRKAKEVHFSRDVIEDEKPDR